MEQKSVVDKLCGQIALRKLWMANNE